MRRPFSADKGATNGNLTFVIPGRATWREPGIHTLGGGYGFRARASRAPE